ncbi:hypothetical protein FRC12_024052 [Ceratobasidium sp. 428]|nr:hypothetical protein FRC12_024052 [Ceratobasidium sp. 428]
MKTIVLITMLAPPGLCLWGMPSSSLSLTNNRGPESGVLKWSSKHSDTTVDGFNDLQARSHRSDCFKDASLAFHTGCESLEFDSNARIKAAVQMTLCELITAERVSLPLECKSLTEQSSPAMVSQCVEALSRSAQHWSSYSGYLREIPQLCTAYRRLNEIDHAKSIYANITLEKAALFSSLDVYHSKLVVREEELEALTKALGSIAVSLGQHSSAIDDSLTRFPDRTEEMIAKIHEQAAILLNAISTSSQLANQNALTNLEYHLRSMMLEAQNSLSLTSKDLNGDVNGLASSLDAIALSWNSRLVAFNKRLDLMWDETFARKLALEAALEDLNMRVSEAAGRVDAQITGAERLQEITSETAVSVQTINSRISGISSTLSHEVESLQSVALELHTNLTKIPILTPRPNFLSSVLNFSSSIIHGKNSGAPEDACLPQHPLC